MQTRNPFESNELNVIPPKAQKIDKKLTAHQHTRNDPYYWMQNREDPKVIQHLNEENDYTKKIMEPLNDLRETLFKEMKNRIVPDDTSAPYPYGDYFYYSRFEEGKDYPIMCRKKGSLQAKEEIIVNLNTLAEGHNFFQVSNTKVSPNHRYLLLAIDTVGRRFYDIKIKDLETGKFLDDEIKNVSNSLAWANDNKTFFYVAKEEKTLREYKVFRHTLGNNVKDDQEMLHEKDNTFYIGLSRSRSGKYIFVGHFATLTTEYSFLSADSPMDHFQLVTQRKKGVEYHVDHHDQNFLITTNYKAKNFRLMISPTKESKMTQWKEIIPHRPNILLESVDPFKNFIVLTEREKGLPQLRVININPELINTDHLEKSSRKSDNIISWSETVYDTALGPNRVYDTNTIRIYYSSFTTPPSDYDYQVQDKSRNLIKRKQVLGDFDPKNYKAHRLEFKSHDGTIVPISLVYRIDKVKKGTPSPLLLYGYGSYGISLDTYFNSNRISLLDRGFVYAQAHIRGGQELGRDWYEDGKLLKKMNTFLDFIKAAEYLIQEEWTDKNSLYAMGGSAGGLLMGAIVNLRPDLFNGIVSMVPFVDVVTTMLDDSIPLTTFEYDEWGNPNDKKYYDYMLKYSPYDNVKKQNYPSMLVMTGLHDSQVQYWEPAKWVSKLRELKTDNNIILFKTDMESGHGGKSGRYKPLEELALVYSFLLGHQMK